MNNKSLVYLLAFACILAINSCTSEEVKTKKTEKKELPLIEMKDGQYTEYYPGRKAVKIKGAMDGNKLKDGKWVFYAENGLELSITHFDHGIREGHSIVKFPTGIINYYGEYHEDKKVGVWKKYDEKGKLVEEKDFGGI